MQLLKALFFAYAGWAVFAPGAHAAQTLDWPACVREVNERNPNLASLRASERAALSEVKASLLRHMPSASFIYEKDQSEVIFPDAFLNTGPSRIDRHGWRGGLNLFSGFGILGANRAAISNFHRSREDTRRVSAQLRFDLRDAFDRLLLVQEREKLLTEIAGRLEADVAMVQIRFDAGLAPRWSLLSAKAQAAEAKWRIQEAALALRAGGRRLFSILGRDGGDSIRVSGSFDAETPPDAPDSGAGDLRTNPEVAFREETLRIAREEVKIARSGFFPTVNLSGQYLWQDSSWPPRIRTWTLGLGINLPVFSAPRVYYLMDAAKERVVQEERRLAGTRFSTLDSIEEAYARYRAAFEKVSVTRALLGAEVEREETLRASFKVGRASYFEWNSAVTRRNQLELALLEDRFASDLSRAAWVRSLGLGLEDALR